MERPLIVYMIDDHDKVFSQKDQETYTFNNQSQEIHEIFNKNITTFLHCDLEKEIHYDKYCSSKR